MLPNRDQEVLESILSLRCLGGLRAEDGLGFRAYRPDKGFENFGG